MKVSYLIDTDWIIHYLIGTKHIQEELEWLRPEGLAVSIISLAEVYEGIYYSKDPDASRKGFEDFLSDMLILPVDEEVCKSFARERGRLRKQGNIIGDFDLLIGATCLCHDLTLLSNNVRHFERIEGLRFSSMVK